MSRHPHALQLGRLPGVALAFFACGALGLDPHFVDPALGGPDSPPSQPTHRVPSSGRVGQVPGLYPPTASPAANPPLALERPSALPPTQAASPSAAPPVPSVELPPVIPALPALEAGPREPPVLWRFRSAAPLSGAAAVNAAGLVYVVSVEGFLHALSPDGAYRWSYGLTGMPVGAPAIDAAGNVYVATSAQRLYAFKPDGRLHWTQTVGARFASPLVWAEPGIVYYAGRDRNLYSVATWGGAPQPHWLGRSANGTIAGLGDGAVAVGVQAPEVQLFRRASALLPIELSAPLEAPLLGGSTFWFALTAGGLAAHDVVTRAEVWTASARRAGLSADERVLVVEADGDLLWLDPASGRELHRATLAADASAAPVVTNSGVVVVPMMSGRLLVVAPAHEHHARVTLAPAPAWPPVWSETSRRVVAAAGGEVVGIDLSAWVAPPRAARDDAEDGFTRPWDERPDRARPPLGSRIVERGMPRGGA